MSNVLNSVKSIARALLYKLKYQFVLDPMVIQELKKRQTACDECVFNSNHAPHAVYRLDKHCVICSCNIGLKKYDLDGHCAIKDYNKQTKFPLRLKWDAYKSNPDDEKQ